MLKFSKCKILVGKILTIEHTLVKFVTLFHRQSFTLYGSIARLPQMLLPTYFCTHGSHIKYSVINVPVCAAAMLYVSIRVQEQLTTMCKRLCVQVFIFNAYIRARGPQL